MIFKSVKNFFSLLEGLIPEPKESSVSDFVDESFGRMKSQEVLAIVLPVAEKANYISENNGIVFGQKEIGLFRYAEPNKLVWIVNFSWLEIRGEKIDSHLDSHIASIKVDDETGLVMSVWQRGMNSEMNYLDFLKLLDENTDLE